MDRMEILKEYTITHTNRESLVLVRGDSLHGVWVHQWPIFEPAPTLADLTSKAFADHLGQDAAPALPDPGRKEDEEKPKSPWSTKTNPNGSVVRCTRRDIHEMHEWQNEFGAYFNVTCPGNDGTRS